MDAYTAAKFERLMKEMESRHELQRTRLEAKQSKEMAGFLKAWQAEHGPLREAA